jgi:hypothetical protein
MAFAWEPGVTFSRISKKFVVYGNSLDNPYSANMFAYLCRQRFYEAGLWQGKTSGPDTAMKTVAQFEKQLGRSVGSHLLSLLGFDSWLDVVKKPSELIKVKDVLMNAAVKLGGYGAQQGLIEQNKTMRTNPNSPAHDQDEYVNFAIYSWAKYPELGPFYHLLVEPDKW